MDPSSPDAQAILQYYDISYHEVLFYELHHQIGKYLLLAGVTVMLWDHITTLPDEIRYVWQVEHRWTIVTVLFGFNRYISPIGFIVRFIHFLLQNHDRPLCDVGDLTAYWNIVSFACVEIVLMLRVWVLYGRSKKLGLFLGAVFTIALAISLIIPSRRPPTDIGVITPFPVVLKFCVRSSPSAYFWLFIIASSVDTITFGLFCVKVYLTWKDSISTPILNVLFTEGAAYYAVILCIFAVSIPATIHREMYIPLMDPKTVILISCIACSRLILSLRGLYHDHMIVGPTTLGTLTKGEHRNTILVSMAPTSSNGAAISLDTLMSVAHDEEMTGYVEPRASA